MQIAEGETLTIRAAPTLTPMEPPTEWPPPLTIPLGIKVTSTVAGIQGVLELLLDGNQWESTLKFNTQGRVTLDGSLKLSFEEFTTPAAAVGKSFDLFDWPTAGPNGQFDLITNPNHVWDLSTLYTTGVVRLVAVVPETSSLAMVASVLMGTMVLRRRSVCAQ